MKVKLKLFFDWGITFEEPYTVSENGNRVVRYTNKREIINGILERYPIEIEGEQTPQEPPKTNKGGNSPSPLRTAPSGENEPFEDIQQSQNIRLIPKKTDDGGANV